MCWRGGHAALSTLGMQRLSLGKGAEVKGGGKA